MERTLLRSLHNKLLGALSRMEYSLNIRQGKPEDILEISDIYKDSVRELCKGEYSPEVISLWENSTPPEARLKSINNGSLWVAEIGGSIGGYLVSVPGELVALFVGSSYSGLGLGRKLCELGISLARKEGDVVTIESTLTAAPFYEKLGFTKVNQGFFSHGHSDIKIPVINMVYDA